MNDATNDATLESSLDEAIGFFQNLHRKLSALEQDASAQHDRLRAIGASVADHERERQIDRQTFTALGDSLDAQAAQLTELRANDRLLDEQLGTVEALVARLQQDQEQLRQQSAALTGDSQRQQDRLKHLETLTGKISADTNSTRQILNILQSDLITQSDTLRELDRHWQAMLAADQNSPPTQTPADAPSENPDSPGAPPGGSPDEPVDQPPAALAVAAERFDELRAGIVAAQQDGRELRQVLSDVQNVLTGQDQRFVELRNALQEQLHLQQQRLDRFETALDRLREIPADASPPDLDPLRDMLAAQAEALRELRETTQRQAPALTQALELQQGAVRETTATVAELQRDSGEFWRALTRLDATIEQQQQRFEAGQLQERELQRELASLQHTTTALEERLSSQAQAFGGHFEQFRALGGDLRNLEQRISTLESVPRRLNALEEDLIGREQGLAQLHEAVRQLQEDSQQAGEALQQTGSGARAGELEARLNEQRQQFLHLNEAIDSIRTDAKTAQEKVVTMATNVAKRIFEFQNQLTATETAHAERLQEAEQKLIQLQAALELMETQRRERRWFSMPAMFTQILLTASAAFLGVLVTVIWTTT